jgi:hypothetical protein
MGKNKISYLARKTSKLEAEATMHKEKCKSETKTTKSTSCAWKSAPNRKKNKNKKKSDPSTFASTSLFFLTLPLSLSALGKNNHGTFGKYGQILPTIIVPTEKPD